MLAEAYDGPTRRVAAEPGEVAERDLPLRVPARRPTGGAGGAAATDAAVRLRLRRGGGDDTPPGFQVALRRGTGMIVRYLDIPRGVTDDQVFHAVLSAGTARGQTEQDRAVEAFLRAAEPPEHREWTARTDRMAARYEPGAVTAIETLFKRSLIDAVRDMTHHAESSTDELPESVRRLFPISPEGEGPPPPPRAWLEEVEARLVGGEWRFSELPPRRRTCALGSACRSDPR